MTKVELVNKVTRTFHKTLFQIKKHSPEILMGVGVVGVVASGVMACKATTKLSTVLEESKDSVDQIHDYIAEKGFSEKYTEEDSKKDLAIVYTQTGLKLVNLYAPAVIVGAVSIGCILTSHHILRKRNIALAAAYLAETTDFKKYRERLVERFGKELDRELKYNIKTKEIQETVVNEDGTEQQVTKTIEVADPNEMYSIYARCFDESCRGWEKDAEYNLVFLKQAQAFANEKLKAQGFLFLNDVYEMLGFDKTNYGQYIGWIYDEEHPVGDNYVDFGIYDIYKPGSRDFVNGYERCVWLDFNHDGNILDLMK